MKVDSGSSSSYRNSVEPVAYTVVRGRRGDRIVPRNSRADTPLFLAIFVNVLVQFWIPVTAVLMFHGWGSAAAYAQAHLFDGSNSAGNGAMFGVILWMIMPASW